MSNFSLDAKQFETLMFGSVRVYTALSVNFTEELVNAQLDAAKTYIISPKTGQRRLEVMLNPVL